LDSVSFADFPLKWPDAVSQMFAVQNSVGYTADSLMNLDCLFSTESPLNAGGTDQSFFNAAAATIFIPLAVFILSNLVRTAYVIRVTRFVRRAENESPLPHPAIDDAEGDIELHECAKSDAKTLELHEQIEARDVELKELRKQLRQLAGEGEVDESYALRGTTVAAASTAALAEKDEKKKKKVPGLVSRKFIAGWIVIFVTLQPMLTKAVFSLFACQQLEDGTTWVRRDMQVGCFGPTHKRWAFGAGIPGVLLYPLGIPVGAGLLLYSVRKELEVRQIKKKFGFLYSGCGHIALLQHRWSHVHSWSAAGSRLIAMLGSQVLSLFLPDVHASQLRSCLCSGPSVLSYCLRLLAHLLRQLSCFGRT